MASRRQNAPKSLRRRLEVRFSCRKALKRLAGKGQEGAGPRHRRGFGGEYDAVSDCDRFETFGPLLTRYPGLCAPALTANTVSPRQFGFGKLSAQRSRATLCMNGTERVFLRRLDVNEHPNEQTDGASHHQSRRRRCIEPDDTGRKIRVLRTSCICRPCRGVLCWTEIQSADIDNTPLS